MSPAARKPVPDLGEQPRAPAATATPAMVGVAAVIVTYNRRAVLPATLDAVLAQSRAPQEVIVVDNASEDGTPAMLGEHYPQVTYVRMPDNEGFAAGLRAGMQAATAHGHRYSWLLDDDSVPQGDALERCLAVAEADPRVGVVGSSGGRLRHGVPDRRAPLEAFSPAAGGPGVRRCDFTLVDGALVSHAAASRAGLPRADFFMMMEDVEYTARIKRAGWEVVVLEDDLMTRGHLGSGGAAPGGSAPPWRGYYQSRNHLAIALEHRAPAEVWGWARRQAKLIVAALLYRDRKLQRVGLRLLGGWHALRGRMGRTIEPPSAQPPAATP